MLLTRAIASGEEIDEDDAHLQNGCEYADEKSFYRSDDPLFVEETGDKPCQQADQRRGCQVGAASQPSERRSMQPGDKPRSGADVCAAKQAGQHDADQSGVGQQLAGLKPADPESSLHAVRSGDDAGVRAGNADKSEHKREQQACPDRYRAIQEHAEERKPSHDEHHNQQHAHPLDEYPGIGLHGFPSFAQLLIALTIRKWVDEFILSPAAIICLVICFMEVCEHKKWNPIYSDP